MDTSDVTIAIMYAGTETYPLFPQTNAQDQAIGDPQRNPPTTNIYPNCFCKDPVMPAYSHRICVEHDQLEILYI